jgi:hypothetical protein
LQRAQSDGNDTEDGRCRGYPSAVTRRLVAGLALALALAACTSPSDSSSNGPSTSPTPTPTPTVTATATATATGTQHQTLTFPALPTVRIGQANPLAATSDAGLTVTYTAGPRRVCTMIVNAPEAQAHGAGTCRVTATQAGDATYAPARPVTRRFTIVKIPQSLRLYAPRSMAVGESALVVSSATSELSVFLSVTGTTAAGDPVCRLEDRDVVALAAGECVVRGEQPGDYQWAPAPSRTRTIRIAVPLPA